MNDLGSSVGQRLIVGEMCKSLVEGFVQLQGEQQVGCSVRVAGSTEDLVLVVPQDLE